MTHTKPAPILINDEKEWEVESILDYRERHSRRQFLVKLNGYANSKSSWELIKGLENAQDLVQAEWNDNMPGKEFSFLFSGYIMVSFTSTGDGFERHAEEPAVNKGSWTLIMIAQGFRYLCFMFEIMFSFCFWGITSTGY